MFTVYDFFQSIVVLLLLLFFFFQAEAGIRSRDVTGVQTCALPVLPAAALDIPATPLKATQSVYPNILFLLDDSGSMQWEIMPEDYLYSYHLFPPPVAQLYGGTGYGEGSGSALYRLPSFREDNIYNVFLRSSGNNTVY